MFFFVRAFGQHTSSGPFSEEGQPVGNLFDRSTLSFYSLFFLLVLFARFFLRYPAFGFWICFGNTLSTAGKFHDQL